MDNNFFASPDMWLLSLGYVSEHSEQNLILYGYISTCGVNHVELLVDSSSWSMKYAIILRNKSYLLYNIQRKLELKKTFLNKFFLLFFLKIFGSYNPEFRLSKHIEDYAGKNWKVSVEVLNDKRYQEITSKNRTKGWFFEDGAEENRSLC